MQTISRDDLIISNQYNATGDGFYNGVLNTDPTAATRSPTVHVRRSLVQVLSTSGAAITPISATPLQLDHCRLAVLVGIGHRVQRASGHTAERGHDQELHRQ